MLAYFGGDNSGSLFTAVTLPLAFTVAIPDFEEDHFTLDFAPDIFKFSVCPLISVAFVLLSLAFVAASTVAVFCGRR